MFNKMILLAFVALSLSAATAPQQYPIPECFPCDGFAGRSTVQQQYPIPECFPCDGFVGR